MKQAKFGWWLATALLAAAPAAAQDKPKLLPDRDVDLTYTVSAQGTTAAKADKPITQRVRWLAADHMQRIDGPGDTVVLADRATSYITIVSSRTKSYIKLDAPAGGVFNPDQHAAFTRGDASSVAKTACTDWKWLDADTKKPRTLCATDDGVVLRMTEDGRTLAEATAVTYRTVKPQTFQVPHGYEPSPALDGATE